MGLYFAKKDFDISPSGISEVKKLAIGGMDQYVLIQSEHLSNPVLLMLHGGPGMPVPGVSNRSRDYALATTTKELVQHYTLVFWDQRGAGKSYSPGIRKNTFNLEQFIADAKEVVQFLKKRFHKNKIYIAGHSWGSVLGLRLAHENPSDFYAYIGISQLINWVENDRLCLQWALRKAKVANHQKAIRELMGCGEPPYLKSVEQWSTLRKWLAKYNAMIYSDSRVKHPGMKLALSIILRSPDYSLSNIMNTFKGFQASYTQRMIEDFAAIDYGKTIPRIELPVIFIHGRKDLQVYGELLERYYQLLDAPAGKKLFWMENSSHMFHPDDAREIERTLIELKDLSEDDRQVDYSLQS